MIAPATTATKDTQPKSLAALGCPDYTMSRDGEIRRLSTGRVISPSTRAGVVNGIRTVTLQDRNDRPAGFVVARVVLQLFGGPMPEPARDYTPAYKDGDRSNCSISNLAWGRRSYNSKIRYASCARLGFPLYRAGSDGSIWRRHEAGWRKQAVISAPRKDGSPGTRHCDLLGPDHSVRLQVALVIYAAFHNVPLADLRIVFRDGDRTNCRLSNLELAREDGSGGVQTLLRPTRRRCALPAAPEPASPAPDGQPRSTDGNTALRNLLLRARADAGLRRCDVAARAGMLPEDYDIAEDDPALLQFSELARVCQVFGIKELPVDLFA